MFGGALADEHIVLSSDVADYRLIHFVTGDFYRFRNDDAAERDDRNVGRSAADVDYHATGRAGNVDAGSDSGGKRFFNKESLARAGLIRGVDDGSLLDLGYAARNADHNSRLEEHISAGAANEVLKHFERHFVLAYNAVFERTYRDDVAGGAAEHTLCLVTDFEYLVGGGVDSDDRRLFKHYSFAFHVYEYRRGAEVDAYVAHEQFFRIIEEFYNFLEHFVPQEYY